VAIGSYILIDEASAVTAGAGMIDSGGWQAAPLTRCPAGDTAGSPRGARVGQLLRRGKTS
jgi:hypothetical protein